VARLDRDELAAWLMQVTRRIDHAVARGARARSELLAHLRAGLDGTTAGLARLTQLAVVSDCVRVAQLAAEAFGGEGPDLVVLVDLAAPAYFMVLTAYDAFADGASTPDAIGQFLAIHRGDPGPFGGASTAWRGLGLARALEAHGHDGALVRELEIMLAHILDALIADAPAAAGEAAHRRLRAVFTGDATPADVGEDEVTRGVAAGDPRDAAFLAADGPDVFTSIAHGAQIHDRDPFDVESIHADARDVFRREVVDAGTPSQHHRGHGRSLLVLGDSGSGKTHLLRAFRAAVHGEHLGYVGYLQMTSEVGDYARYVLRHVIDSLERPYAPPGAPAPALRYLSEGLITGDRVPADALARLREAEMSLDELTALVTAMVDHLLRHDDLAGLEPDLIQALLLIQRGDPALDRRVIRFLRCEPLTPHEQRLLGGLAARDQPDDPVRTLRQLAAIAYELQLAAFVVLVDQVEDSVPDGRTVTRLQQAIDVLRGLADAVPSAVVVIACLDDVYSALRDKLSRSVLDRLERDPPPVRLAGVRQREDIEAMLARRLAYLYASAGAAVRADAPLYPFTADHITQVTTWRARDALAKLGEYHAACVAAGTILAARPEPAAAPAPVSPRPAPPPIDLARLFNDTVSSITAPPTDDATLLVLVDEALHGAATELDLELTFTEHGEQLIVEGKTLPRRTLEVCNGATNGHRLRDQLDTLRDLAARGTLVIALRTGTFEFTPRTKIATKVQDFRAAGGRTVTLDDRQLCAVIAVRTLREAHPALFPAWQRQHRPLAHLDFVAATLDLDSIPRPPSGANTQPLPQAKRPPGK
jgi:energy-coupling factor transporter ATP-binding protein EcfA2